MRVNKCGEQMLKMKPQHRKQGKQGTCTICTVCSMYSTYSSTVCAVMSQNEQEFLVRDIIAHRGDHHRRSSMEFLVRWNHTRPSCMSTNKVIVEPCSWYAKIHRLLFWRIS